MNFLTKKDLRKAMKQTLTDFNEKLSWKEKHSLAENLCEKVTSLDQYKNAGLILAYIPDTLEADCTPIILDALEKGKKLCVPKVDSETLKLGKSQMDFYFLEEGKALESQLETGAYGIREPKAELKKFAGFRAAALGEGVAKDCEAVAACGSGTAFTETSPIQKIFMLVPGVAFTKDGKRLGHGKGFYDIYIERMKKAGLNPYLCGICLPCQLVEDIPTDEHDILMDKVVF